MVQSVHRPFDDCAFVHLCDAGEVPIDNLLSSLLDAEERYLLSREDCDRLRCELETAAGNPSGAEQTSREACNTDWRYRISRWMLRASDEFRISRGTALIALAICDRHLLTRKITRHYYQVAAITCLFVASKLYEKRPIKMVRQQLHVQLEPSSPSKPDLKCSLSPAGKSDALHPGQVRSQRDPIDGRGARSIARVLRLPSYCRVLWLDALAALSPLCCRALVDCDRNLSIHGRAGGVW